MKEDKKAVLSEILKQRSIRTVFQPIFDVKNSKIIGYEALSRGPKGSILERPDVLFEAAREFNMLWELEFLCRSLAIERASEKGLDKFLFLNVDPRIIRDEKFKRGFTNTFLKSYNIEPEKIIFEITEKTAIEDYKAFKEVLDHYVRQGYKIAIDDTGAGYSGMRLITETKPQFIKLDMELIRDIDKDSFKQALCRNLLTLSKITNMKLIAEGVETINEVNTLINIGVEYLQGYFLAKPREDFQEIPHEVVSYINDILNSKLKEKLYTSKTYPVGKIVRIDEPISLSYKGSELKKYFENSKVQGVTVVKDKIPVGLIMKNKFNSMLAMPYGNAIYLGRNIDIMMDHNPLIVDYNTPIAEVSTLAMARQEENLYDYVIVTKGMEYYGIVTIKRLLESATELELKYARHLNPLTGLPGNVVIEEKLNNIISSGDEAGVFYIDIDNFKSYNDIYGFENGDKIIKLVAQIVYDVVDKHVQDSAFVGHIGGDDFIIITDNCNCIEIICKEIIEKFDNYITSFYNIEHLNKGYIISTDREGNIKKFSLMSISIAVIKGFISGLKTPFSIAQKAAEIKKKCKKESISNYIIEIV